MKRVTIKNLLLGLPMLLLFSCSTGLKVSSDYDRSADFSSYKTFSLFYLTTNKNVNELNAQRIWNSIREEMTKKGYVENDNNPDLLVNAVTVVKNKKYVTASTTNYGYGGLYRPYGFWAPAAMPAGQTTFSSYDYKNGSLMLDVVDAKTKRLVWQGTGNGDINKQPKNPDEAIRDVVAKILARFPDPR